MTDWVHGCCRRRWLGIVTGAAVTPPGSLVARHARAWEKTTGVVSVAQRHLLLDARCFDATHLQLLHLHDQLVAVRLQANKHTTKNAVSITAANPVPAAW